MTMVERMARAMAGPTVYDADNAEFWNFRALLAIKELRRPTASMFTAGQRAVSKSDPKAVRTVDWEAAFVAMIDAAISEATK